MGEMMGAEFWIAAGTALSLLANWVQYRQNKKTKAEASRTDFRDDIELSNEYRNAWKQVQEELLRMQAYVLERDKRHVTLNETISKLQEELRKSQDELRKERIESQKLREEIHQLSQLVSKLNPAK